MTDDHKGGESTLPIPLGDRRSARSLQPKLLGC